MNLEQRKILWWDLDETLVHSFQADSKAHADHLYDQHSEHWPSVKFKIRHDGWYVSHLRNTTRRMLEFSRNLLGEENVFILSRGDVDYVRWVNVHLDLGFDPNMQIFGYEDILSYSIFPLCKNTFNVLIDNESYEYQSTRDDSGKCKIEFLNFIPKEQHIHVDGFNIWKDRLDPLLDKAYVADLTNRIKTAFKL